MNIKKTVILSIALYSSLFSYGIPDMEIDSARIYEYQVQISKRAHQNRYLRGGIYSAVTLVAAFSIYNFFKKPLISDEDMKKLVALASQNMTNKKNITSKSLVTKCVDFGSDVASFFCNGVLFVAQNILFSAVVDVAAHRSERVFKFPGKIDWFVSNETHLEELLKDYKGYGDVLSSSVHILPSEVDRACESIISQLSVLIESVERVLAYMQYVQVKLAEKVKQESMTVQDYLVQTTNEFIRTVKDEKHKKTILAHKIQQFVSEMTSLCNRFLRLQDPRVF